MSWKQNHILLAQKLVLHITEVGHTTFDKLEARARTHGIDMYTFDAAIALIHKLPSIKRTVAMGTVKYQLQSVEKKVKEPGSHLTWVRNNYPVMDSSNDGSGIDLDFSYLFMTPDELDAYKAAVRGVAYIPHEYTRE